MSGSSGCDDREPVRRTGGEAKLQRSLQDEDRQHGGGRVIGDNSYSKDRTERRRGRFIDIHADEDHDPDTSEADQFESSQGSRDDRPQPRSKLARMRQRLLDRVRGN